MKNIIVPVDFSIASLNAADYAAELAMCVQAGITLVHVCQFAVSMSDVPMPGQVSSLKDDAEENLQQLKTKLSQLYNGELNVQTEIREGNVIKQVDAVCKEVKPFAVVMGAHGSSAAERLLFGSSTLEAIKRLPWPLIIVPKDARFKNTGRIGLAFDLEHMPAAVHADEIKMLLKALNARLHVLHIDTGKERMLSQQEATASAWLRQNLEEVTPTFHFINKENVEQSINEFAERNNLDMLIVMPGKHGLLEGIFHKSSAKRIVLNAHVPVLSIHE